MKVGLGWRWRKGEGGCGVKVGWRWGGVKVEVGWDEGGAGGGVKVNVLAARSRRRVQQKLHKTNNKLQLRKCFTNTAIVAFDFK